MSLWRCVCMVMPDLKSCKKHLFEYSKWTKQHTYRYNAVWYSHGTACFVFGLTWKTKYKIIILKSKIHFNPVKPHLWNNRQKNIIFCNGTKTLCMFHVLCHIWYIRVLAQRVWYSENKELFMEKHLSFRAKTCWYLYGQKVGQNSNSL